MKNIFWIISGLWILFPWGCSSDTQSSENKPVKTEALTPEEDTRLWVKEAYARMDVMKQNVTFNAERAAILKSRADQETDPIKKFNLIIEYAAELAKTGRTAEAIEIYNYVYDYIKQYNLQMPPIMKQALLSAMAITYMRHGEIENCLKNHNHESCFLPIQGDGVHQLPYGSRNAITLYETILEEFPDDLESKYLLNIAYMTLGEYPAKVPAKWRIDPSWFRSKVKMQPFDDIAPQLGLNRNGLAGGVAIEDFTNDGWLDLIITSWSPKEELLFYKNNGDGTFSDQTEAYGLKGHVGVLNLNYADINNDGWMDIYLMRGGWYQTQGDIPNTLLMNTGSGFRDVTLNASLTKAGATQASAWADFNLDGWIDLVVAYESLPGYERGIDLYINQKGESFKNEATAYGLTMNHFFKGCVATDVNNDKYPDIYFSSIMNNNFIAVNQGASGKSSFTFTDPGHVVSAPKNSFPCWSFDYNNDGSEDIWVSGYSNEGTPAKTWMESHMGKADRDFLPKLYQNKGNMVFEEVGISMGLTEVAYTMGCNFGDINTDGFLDFYLATGNPLYQSIVPNKMYLNMEGKKFEDVSYSGGFANIQKGHGVGFGDFDHDGDEDMYVVIGGAFDGDGFYNCLFENPNEHQNNWLILDLTGTTANKDAIGARVTVSVQENGAERKIYRTVTSGASFGGNSMALEIGLRKATSVSSVTVQWPCRDCPDQSFTGMQLNKAYSLTQGESAPAPIQYQAVKMGGKAGEHHHSEHMQH